MRDKVTIYLGKHPYMRINGVALRASPSQFRALEGVLLMRNCHVDDLIMYVDPRNALKMPCKTNSVSCGRGLKEWGSSSRWGQGKDIFG